MDAEAETFYMDEDPMIKETLEKEGFCLVVGPGEIDKQIRKGITITSDDCKIQAEWSIDQRKFAPFTAQYLRMFSGYEDCTTEMLEQRKAFSKQDKQLIGLIELLGGTLKHYYRQGSGYPLFFIEEPETHLHPKQQREVIKVILLLKENFGK